MPALIVSVKLERVHDLFADAAGKIGQAPGPVALFHDEAHRIGPGPVLLGHLLNEAHDRRDRLVVFELNRG